MNTEDYEEKLKNAESLRTYLSNQRDAMQAEINQLHRVLDMLPNPPARKSTLLDGQEEWERVTYSTVERFIGWIVWNVFKTEKTI